MNVNTPFVTSGRACSQTANQQENESIRCTTFATDDHNKTENESVRDATFETTNPDKNKLNPTNGNQTPRHNTNENKHRDKDEVSHEEDNKAADNYIPQNEAEFKEEDG